jgi:hypothetical protein
MKRLFLLSLLITVSVFTNAQNQLPPAVFYDYDPAGNRTLRRILIDTDRRGDTTATEQFEEPPLNDGSILAYPNPTTGGVNIGVSPNLLEKEDGRYVVVDLSGREIRKGSIIQSQTVLDLTGEASGNYILTVFVGKRREKWQIIKQ